MELSDQKVLTVPELHVAVWLSEVEELLQAEEVKVEMQDILEFLDKQVQEETAEE